MSEKKWYYKIIGKETQFYTCVNLHLTSEGILKLLNLSDNDFAAEEVSEEEYDEEDTDDE